MIGNYSKFIAALLAAAGVIAASHLLSGSVEAWIDTAIAAVGAALVYLVPNAPASTTNTHRCGGV